MSNDGGESASILWRRLDRPGHDASRLIRTESGVVLEGSALFNDDGRPCRLDYRVVCDPSWRTMSARVTGWRDARPLDLAMEADAARRWMLNGRACPEVTGCDDVDLSFTPATNLLPIRRLRLAVGAQASVRAAWLRFPELTLELLEQAYTRVAETQYRYESRGGEFVALLETNTSGFVTRYPDLWQVEERG